MTAETNSFAWPNRFINLDDLSINLIDSINPFQRAYEILSKSLTPEVLHTIQYEIESKREDMTKEEAILLVYEISA